MLMKNAIISIVLPTDINIGPSILDY